MDGLLNLLLRRGETSADIVHQVRQHGLHGRVAIIWYAWLTDPDVEIGAIEPGHDRTSPDGAWRVTTGPNEVRLWDLLRDRPGP